MLLSFPSALTNCSAIIPNDCFPSICSSAFDNGYILWCHVREVVGNDRTTPQRTWSSVELAWVTVNYESLSLKLQRQLWSSRKSTPSKTPTMQSKLGQELLNQSRHPTSPITSICVSLAAINRHAEFVTSSTSAHYRDIKLTSLLVSNNA